MSDGANTSHLYPECIAEVSSTNVQPGRCRLDAMNSEKRHAQISKIIKPFINEKGHYLKDNALFSTSR